MSASRAELAAKMTVATQLQGVVRTMRAVAASGIAQYEQAVRAVADYTADVELAIGLFLPSVLAPEPRPAGPEPVQAIVFGSDQGLIGPFNEVLAAHVGSVLGGLQRGRLQVWAVGERVAGRLQDAGWPVDSTFSVPGSVHAIAPLVSRIQLASGQPLRSGEVPRVHVFHHRPATPSGHEPVHEQLLPLDAAWMQAMRLPSRGAGSPPERVGPGDASLRMLLGEYLFIRLVRACAESLASENAARLEAMRRAEQNISELLQALQTASHRKRQQAIDAELFDLLAGYEGLSGDARAAAARPVELP